MLSRRVRAWRKPIRRWPAACFRRRRVTRDRADHTRDHRSPRPSRTTRPSPRPGRLHAQGWGDRELDLPAHPITECAARAGRGWPRPSPASGWCSRPAPTRCAPTTPTTGSAPTPPTPTSRGNQTTDAVLVIEDGDAVLYARPRSSRETDEFFRDRQYGELWAGRRPSLHEMSSSLGLPVRHIDELPSALPAAARPGSTAASPPSSTTWSRADETRDEDFARVISEMRLVKDEWEVGELQEACDITTLGFEDSVREWDTCSSTASAGSRARSSAAPARWATTSATTRSSAAASTPRRCTGSTTPARSRPASWCCSTWASRDATSTPPT